MDDNLEKISRCYAPPKFYIKAQKLLERACPDEYVLLALDFDNFKYINDLFGYQYGDQTLASLTKHFSRFLKDREIFSRINADHFVFLIEAEVVAQLEKKFLEMADVRECLSDFLPDHYNFISSGGFFYITDPKEKITDMIDKANFARKRAKGNHVSTFLHYDKEMSDELKWKKEITLSMEMALENKDFEMYLQPKVLMKNNEIIGAEALVRWNNPEKGIIYPDKFIPVLEQNGFVKLLDFYMLEEACLFLKECEDSGLPMLPISVNFSKIHIGTLNFVERIHEKVQKYGIEPKYIEIELTESVLSKDFNALVKIAGGLKALGFRVSLDDFGSQYSSLSYLKDLPVDIIKIDKAFLDTSTDTTKGRLIISKMVELIKSLRLTSVMEGVEEEEQVDFLKKLSCDIGQGYYYSRPMTVVKFREFVKTYGKVSNEVQQIETKTISENPGSYLDEIPEEFKMDNWDLYVLGQNIEIGLMKGYLGEDPSIQYINKKALDYLGYTYKEFKEILHNKMSFFIHPEERHLFESDIRKLMKYKKSMSFSTKAIRKDGKIIYIEGQLSYVIDDRGNPIGLYAFQDVTERIKGTEALEASLHKKIKELETLYRSEKESRAALRLLEQSYRIIYEQSDDIIFEWDFTEDHIVFSDTYEKVFGYMLMSDNARNNEKNFDRVHPEDREAVRKWIKNTYKKSGKFTFRFRIENKDGKYIKIKVKSTGICNEKGEVVKALGVLKHSGEESL